MFSRALYRQSLTASCWLTLRECDRLLYFAVTQRVFSPAWPSRWLPSLSLRWVPSICPGATRTSCCNPLHLLCSTSCQRSVARRCDWVGKGLEQLMASLASYWMSAAEICVVDFGRLYAGSWLDTWRKLVFQACEVSKAASRQSGERQMINKLFCCYSCAYLLELGDEHHLIVSKYELR